MALRCRCSDLLWQSYAQALMCRSGGGIWMSGGTGPSGSARGPGAPAPSCTVWDCAILRVNGRLHPHPVQTVGCRSTTSPPPPTRPTHLRLPPELHSARATRAVLQVLFMRNWVVRRLTWIWPGGSYLTLSSPKATPDQEIVLPVRGARCNRTHRLRFSVASWLWSPDLGSWGQHVVASRTKLRIQYC